GWWWGGDTRVDLDRWRRREVRDCQTHRSAGGDRLSRRGKLPDHGVLGLQRAGVARHPGDSESELLDHRASFARAASEEIGHLHCRRTLAQYYVDSPWELHFRSG